MVAESFRYQHRVTYAECTVGNHVYYGRYLDLLEAARGDFFRKLNLSFAYWQQQEVIFPVLECRLRYKSPARYDDVITIEVWPTLAEGVRLNFGYRILNAQETPLLEGETLHVCAALNEKPKRLPVELIRQLQPFLRPGNGSPR